MFNRPLIWAALLVLTVLACGAINIPHVQLPQVQTDTPAPTTTAVYSPAPSPTSSVARANRVQKNITYCTVNGVELKMDIYYPNTTQITPLVVYVHGGGWSRGDKTEGAGMIDMPALLDAGFTVASLNYRLAPEYKFPAMIEDVKCAIRSLRAHASDYNIDPAKIGVWGGSAGGHLVNLLGTADSSAGFDVGEYLDQSSRVQAVVDMFGPADLTVDFSGGYDRLKNSVFGGFDTTQASPVTYISLDDPPFLILQGDADQVVPLSQSQEFYDKLAAAGVDAQLIIVHNGPHGLGALNESPSRDKLTTMIVQFFVKYLK